jgi:tetratricopeptide (TPR) repeat protein
MSAALLAITEFMSSSSLATSMKSVGGCEATNSSKPFKSPALQILIGCLLLGAAVLACYNPVTHNGFLNYDDDRYITDNPHVRAGLTWPTVQWAFTTYEQGNWHPLTWLSHALDCRLFGLNPAGHHYVSSLLHAINAVLLFLLLQRATGFRWRSLMVAALFALHPINVESVAWASERKNVLSMMFFLLALYAYGWYARTPRVGRYAAVAAFFALAALSKPQVVAFPLLLLLWDYWPQCRIGVPTPISSTAQPLDVPKMRMRWLIVEKVPLLLLSGASVVVTIKAQRAGGGVKALSVYSPLLRFETAVISYVRYLGKALWPSNLAALYPHPTQLYPAWKVVAAAIILIVITVLVLRARDRRYLLVGWFWFLGSLVPMIGLVQVGFQAMADRYAYIPFIGLFLIVVWLVADSAGNLANDHQIHARWIAIPAICWLAMLGILTYRQVGYWHDAPSFWTHTLAVTQDNYIAQDTLGDFLLNHGQTQEAVAHFRAALAVRADDLSANLNLGNYENSRGNFSAAIEHYGQVARKAEQIGLPGKNLQASACLKLGSIYRRTGDPTRAAEYFETTLQLVPGQPQAMIGLGLIAERKGNFADAVRHYSQAIAVEPTDIGYLLLAHAFQEEGRMDEAREAYELAGRFSPNLAETPKAAEALLSEVNRSSQF